MTNPWPLKVGDKIRLIRITDGVVVGFDLEGVIIEQCPSYADIRFDNPDLPNYTFGPYFKDSNYFTWFFTDCTTTTDPTTANPTGATCRRCHEYNPHAESTREDDTYVCYLCRQDGWGITWGDR